MMRRVRELKGQKGLSLIEVTIMLLVLMLLTGVLAPEMWDFIKKAQYVKVKEDCEAIAVAIIRLKFDVGCLKLNGALPCDSNNHPWLMHSEQGNPATAANVIPPASDWSPNVPDVDGNYAGANYNWYMTQQSTTLEDQLATNLIVQYPVHGGVALNPFAWEVGGWHGAYLTPPIGPDPWGSQYVVNSIFIDAQGSLGPAGSEGNRNHGWNYDSFCLSAGPNRYYETPFAITGFFGSAPVNDDFITVITAFSH